MKLASVAVSSALIVIAILACAGQAMAEDQSAARSSVAQSANNESNASEVQSSMRLRVTANDKTTVFELNNSQAAKDLYAQLPLNIKVENYSDNEKIFYPPKKLNTSDTLLADAKAGTLAYYAPWGDVVMFYKKFGSATGLYELGQAVSGSENLSGMSGSIQVEKDLTP